MSTRRSVDFTELATNIKAWAKILGFQEVKITAPDLHEADERLTQWLAQRFHGSMSYLERNREKRRDPSQLVPGTQRILMVRMDYLPTDPRLTETLRDPSKGYIARYALGRDYHKLIRKRLRALAEKIELATGPFHYRAFADSAPVFEKPLAAQAGIGWMGKNTLILNRHAGSWFFLGALYTDLPLPVDTPTDNHCGRCTACIDICPTQAIVAPYVLDARRCISYLTIEHKGSIPVEFRRAMGNRIFGCDDCQIICPWNKFAKHTQESDFLPRHQLDHTDLITLFNWSEAEFEFKTTGSAIRRAGYVGWLRNIAIALGNAPASARILNALEAKQSHPSELVQEHVAWALKEQRGRLNQQR